MRNHRFQRPLVLLLCLALCAGLTPAWAGDFGPVYEEPVWEEPLFEEPASDAPVWEESVLRSLSLRNRSLTSRSSAT